jgi:ornithine carbamoyltransferase
MGMVVQLCHPPGWGLDPEIMKTCATNAQDSGGEFALTSSLKDASHATYDIVYARHWGPPALGDDVGEWYCQEQLVRKARFIHPMPIERGVEAAENVVDSSSSLTSALIRNKHFVLKAILAKLACTAPS